MNDQDKSQEIADRVEALTQAINKGEFELMNLETYMTSAIAAKDWVEVAAIATILAD